MSMILDALSRAEKERQTENVIGLDTARYVTSSTIKEDRFKKWILIALGANFALIILLSLGYAWKTYLQSPPLTATGIESEQVQIATQAANTQEQPVQAQYQAIAEPIEVGPIETVASEQLAPQSNNLSKQENTTVPGTSLSDEAKVKQSAVIKTPIQKPIKNIIKKIPPVQYSSRPLSAPTQTSEPTVASISAAVERQRVASNASSSYAKLSEIPVNERSQLSDYQVNVHVYDDSGQGSFVLINMVKYKQGDQLPGGRAMVSAIVPEGVVIDYGNGKAQIERDQ